MRTRNYLRVVVDLISAQVEVAEIAKAGAMFGARVIIEPDPEHDTWRRAVIERTSDEWLSADIARLVYLEAMAHNMTIDAVLAAARLQLQGWNAPMDRPPSDAPGIGEKPA